MSRIVFLAIGLMTLVSEARPARAELPPLIPRRVLFGNPSRTNPQLSPDGKRLAFLVPDKNDVLQVAVQTVGKDDTRVVTADRKRGIRNYAWTYAPDSLIYVQDDDGDENYHVYLINLADNLVRDLTPFQGVRAEILGIHPDVPNEMLVGLNIRDRKVHDVYRIDLTTGAAVLDTKNPGDVLGWEVDARFRVRGAQAAGNDGGTVIRVRADDKAEWQEVVTWGPEDADGRVIGFSGDGRSLWLTSSENRDTLALVKRDLLTKKDTLIAEKPKADAGSVLFNPITHEVEAVAFNRARVEWQPVSAALAADLKFLQEANPGQPTVVSRTKDMRTWLVAYSSDVQSTEYFVYDRQARQLKALFKAQPELDKYQLAPMKPVTISTRDGLEVVCYLTLPVGLEARKMPLVLLVHGGPWSRDSWGYNAQVQWLANRGYGVLQVNYRGSAGFGKKFLHAGDREWAGKMHDDLLDAVAWTIKEGTADPKRVAIFGGSYGGYAALVGATFTPDTFACAVSVVGPSNLVTLLKSIPPYWEPQRKLFALRVGDVETEEAFLKARSPLFKADQIKAPLLIAQGARDPRVKQAESEQMVAAMRKANKPVEYLLFEDEGHGFVRPQNRMRFYAVAEVFLAKYLGGSRIESIPLEPGAMP
jgi:dipeptidyl aminopeptidase/acylaminoacyl peptidase